MDDLISLEIAPPGAQVGGGMQGGAMGGGDLLGGMGGGMGGGDLLGGMGMQQQPQQPQQPPAPQQQQQVMKALLVGAEAGAGMEVQGAIARKNGAPILALTFANKVFFSSFHQFSLLSFSFP